MIKINEQKTDKLNLIDQKTYEKLKHENDKQSSDTSNKKRIKNLKYVRTRCEFNLLSYLKPPKERSSVRKLKVRNLKTIAITKPIKKRGKTREGGRRKILTRLKKCIAQHRKTKRELAEKQNKINENGITECLDTLKEKDITESLSTLKIKDESFDTSKANIIKKESSTSAQTTPSPPNALNNLSTATTLHSRRFRSYCDNCTTARLGELTDQLLRQLNNFQRQKRAQNEIKAHAHRRFVIGFREAQNFLNINKVKLLIIAPDCEECAGEGGLDEKIAKLKTQCQSHQVPYAFSLQRRQLAYTLYKKVPISCVAVLDYDGARDIFAQLIDTLQETKQSYKAKVLELNKNKLTTCV